MQEISKDHRPRPETRYIENIDAELAYDGDIETLRTPTIAEEQTHAAEILALFTGRGIIPREYVLEAGELVSQDGKSLSSVLDSGIIESLVQINEGKVGASKEIERRKIERSNLDIIAALPIGTVAIEYSAADLDWTSEERKIQGYPDDTMVRITARVDQTTYKQLNIILQTADLEVVNRCRQQINKSDISIWNASELLANVQVVRIGEGGIEALAQRIEAEYVQSKVSLNPGILARSALGRVISRRRVAKELAKTNSWDYVLAQPDVFNALFDSFVVTSMLEQHNWLSAASIARGGAWYKLIERLTGQDETSVPTTPDDLFLSAHQAATLGEEFVGCGGKIDMKSLMAESSTTFIDRLFQAAELMNNKTGHGRCASCGKKGDLYGCGICGTCNRTWCERYVLTGDQLEIKKLKNEVLRKNYRRYRGRAA